MNEQASFSVRLADGREFGPAAFDQIVQWAREGRVPMEGLLVPADGSAVRSVLTEPALREVLQSPPTMRGPLQPPPSEAPLSGMIPYKNPPALVGYYLGVFSFVPVLGMLLAIPAIICGIVGLVKRGKNPKIKGAAHAIIAILGGILGPLFWFAIVALFSSR